MIEQHPHEAWQQAVFGCAHISQHRTLPRHIAALRHVLADLDMAIPREEQIARLRTLNHTFAHDLHHANRPFDPAMNVVHGARAYNWANGMADPHAMPYHRVRTTADTIDRVGQAYNSLPDFDHNAIPHFHAMGEEVGRQFDHLTRPRSQGGMGIHVESVDHDPYPTVHHMVQDLRENNRIKVLGTHVTGGHPYFSNDQNDQFRAVHDAFGHAATGRGFDANGEEAAYLAHSRMFSHKALPAMQSETRGQNGFVHLNGDFGPQKIAVMPEHIRNIPIVGAEGRQLATTGTAVDWNEYRRTRDAQDRRYERAGTVGGQAEYDEYFGRGEHAGGGQERRITPKDWMRYSHEPSFEELPPSEHEWHRGYDLGARHSDTIDNDEFDRAHSISSHPDHFFSGYTEGLRSVASANPLSTPAEAVAFEEGKQNVRDVNGIPLCDWHADRAKELMGISDQIGRQTGLVDETEPHTHTETPTYPGRCVACIRGQQAGEGRPWETPVGGGYRPTPMQEHQISSRSWPNQPKRTGPFMPLPHSTSGLDMSWKKNKLPSLDEEGNHVMYHGTNTDLKPGSKIVPGHKSRNRFSDDQYVYFTHEPSTAAQFAGGERGFRGAGRVYTVKPMGEYGEDPQSSGYRTKKPLVVTGEVPREKAMDPINSMRRVTRSDVRHNKHFIGRDADYDRDADEFERQYYDDDDDWGHEGSLRFAVRRGQRPLAPDETGLQRIAHQISIDMPDVVVWRKVAHDSGDGQTVYHCPFCGSGQVIATSDGGIECEFCHASFTVQVQPQYPAFPQTIDGSPVNVPGMGPDFTSYGGTPPGEEAPVPMDGEEDDDSGNNPFAEGESETEPQEEDDDEDGDEGGGGNPFAKKSFVTTTGAVLSHEAYLKHLALACSPDRKVTLARVRALNGTR